MEMILFMLGLVVGGVIGVLYQRRNGAKIDKALAEAVAERDALRKKFNDLKAKF